ncbi:NO signaling/Golgi transport ligand-binding domain-containing protein [Pavlovales sp. CCMP2436]|nr:NO signaling/Golgi transport ligand-binding domain-containing protein [Pavlovales sp. CCMP2436]
MVVVEGFTPTGASDSACGASAIGHELTSRALGVEVEMHGFIHMTLRSLMLEKSSEAMWAQLLVQIGTTELSFLELQMHEDALTVHAVTTAAELLGIEVGTALKLFGIHFVKFMEETNYMQTVLSFGIDLLDFLHNIDELHANLRKAPKHFGCFFPHFTTSMGVDGRQLLSYSSSRGELLSPLVEGILPEIAKIYGQQLSMKREPLPAGGYAVTWELSVESQEQIAEAAEAAMISKTRSKRSDQEIRAASKWHEALASSLRLEPAKVPAPVLNRELSRPNANAKSKVEMATN